ncbi:hypothetical protein [Winogradskyella sp.]|uniref:hypothetical protein n=1 Tax=Winogradskyella sp. TaxID=1883156 RepID=UPI002621DAF2|nr:hypothetical protein [Winogradskyella sp.]
MFNKRAFHLSSEELYVLKDCVQTSLKILNTPEDTLAEDCSISILLDSSTDEFYINISELRALDDLVCGTLFHMNFDNVIADLIYG